MRRISRWSSLAAIALAALASTTRMVASEPTPLRQAELRHLLDHDCGSCHGLTRRGGLGSPLVPEALADRDDDALIDAILYGRPGTPMPPWDGELTRTDARWLVELLRRR